MSAGSIRWGLISGRAISGIADQWEALVKRAGPVDPFLTPQWLLPLANDGLEFLAGYDGERLAALAPMRRLGPFGRGLGGAVASESFHLLLADEGVSPAQAVSGLRRVMRRGVLMLRLDGEHTLAPFNDGVYEALAEAGCPILAQEGKASPFVAVQGSFDDFLLGRLSSSARATRRRNARKLAKAGAVEYQTITGAEGLEAVFHEMAEIEASGWKRDSGPFARHRRQATRAQLTALAEAGALLIIMLRLDGRAVAANIDFVWDGRLLQYSHSFHEDFGALSPGAQLYGRAVEQAFDMGARAFDLLGSSTRLKETWASGHRQRRRLYVFRPGLAGRLLAGAVGKAMEWATARKKFPDPHSAKSR